MAFPKKILLFFPDGWTDLGLRCPINSEDSKLFSRTFVMHAFCQTPLRRGKEDGSDELFVFCPHCMIKIK